MYQWIFCALEEVFENLSWEKNKIKINAGYLNNLRCIDDVNLVTSSKEEYEIMLKKLDEIEKNAGLAMNISKKNCLTKKY